MLELAARAVGLAAWTDDQPEHLRLANRATKFHRRQAGAKVGDGPRGRRHRDAPATSHLTGQQRRAAVQSNAFAWPSASNAWKRHVDWPVERLQQFPQGCRASVADSCSLPVGEGGRHPPSVLRNPRMTVRVYPPMNSIQPTAGHLAGNRARTESRAEQLRLRDHAVLPLGNFGDCPVWSGAFFPHTGNKAPPRQARPRGRWRSATDLARVIEG